MRTAVDSSVLLDIFTYSPVLVLFFIDFRSPGNRTDCF